ncbi:hypothetical protein [Curtobacterium sp. MMLR14_014]|uniref:hypothetical protein n=1 Tax=Curtobacterium sp. MMLR14_014 TaxID=1898744 RepID=UPI0020C8CE64|nr:hypothetical protein [Curtobacterium sp. MMLR14_014]
MVVDVLHGAAHDPASGRRGRDDRVRLDVHREHLEGRCGDVAEHLGAHQVVPEGPLIARDRVRVPDDTRPVVRQFRTRRPAVDDEPPSLGALLLQPDPQQDRHRQADDAEVHVEGVVVDHAEAVQRPVRHPTRPARGEVAAVHLDRHQRVRDLGGRLHRAAEVVPFDGHHAVAAHVLLVPEARADVTDLRAVVQRPQGRGGDLGVTGREVDGQHRHLVLRSRGPNHHRRPVDRGTPAKTRRRGTTKGPGGIHRGPSSFCLPVRSKGLEPPTF